MSKPVTSRESVFSAVGFTPTIDRLTSEIQKLYCADHVPWVIGYSGGKDSTAVLQLVWTALSRLRPDQRQKPVHVISTDTLVENPIVATWVSLSLERIKKQASASGLPIYSHRLTPDVSDTFWVNLIGKGYPAPRNKFRWCTERLKIKPSNTFIRDVVQDSGEAILVLGTRRAESTKRAASMSRHGKSDARAKLAENANLSNCLVYTPIEDWTNDDVWLFLMRQSNPWDHSNKDLLTMYKGASADGECPLVVDTSTPSCGNSRFGCWVCTLVDEDKSMGAMIQNDSEKEWMVPLLRLRNEFDFRGDAARQRDRERRDFRRITGRLTYYTDSSGETALVPGPYTQSVRAYWLRRVLQTQREVREHAPPGLDSLELITLEELEEIRRIWVAEKHEIEDLLVTIYEEELGEAYPGAPLSEDLVFDADSLHLLRDLSDNDNLHYEMLRNLLDIERRYRTMNARRGLFKAIEDTVERCFYSDATDALARASQMKQAREACDERNDEKGERTPSSAPSEGDLQEPDLFHSRSQDGRRHTTEERL